MVFIVFRDQARPGPEFGFTHTEDAGMFTWIMTYQHGLERLRAFGFGTIRHGLPERRF